ncbi:MAG: nicotinate (nicotinamide) nucleotide adenylyltransferase [Flavobacteriaceae bacterium]|nr:nicotinate (nicotinamide) nucleotide adenylyltransferase [Flavobacteriaceae bacterium]
MNKNIGLFFGTFNPIHHGHLMLADYLLNSSNLDALWFVVTPQNPFKKKQSLLDNHQRLHMVHLAIEEFPQFSVSDIEFGLPQPNYTVHTLAVLEEKFPEYRLNLIVGEDNLKNFTKWKNYEVILSRYHLLVYPRLGDGNIPELLQNHPSITFVDAPKIEVSSTMIRSSIEDRKPLKTFMPFKVWQYIDEMHFYR